MMKDILIPPDVDLTFSFGVFRDDDNKTTAMATTNNPSHFSIEVPLPQNPETMPTYRNTDVIRNENNATTGLG